MNSCACLDFFVQLFGWCEGLEGIVSWMGVGKGSVHSQTLWVTK